MARIIYFDISATIVALTILLILILKKYTGDRTDQLFIVMLTDTMLAGGFDIIDSLYGTAIPGGAGSIAYQYITNFLCFATRNLIAPLYVLFLFSALGVWDKLSKKLSTIILFACPYVCIFVALCANLSNHKLYYIDKNGVYNRGPLMAIFFVETFIYMVISVWLLIRYRKSISVAQLMVLISFVVFNGLSIVIQQFYSGLRLEVFAVTVTLLMTTTIIRRPDELIDSIAGTHSYNAFMEDMHKAYLVDSQISVMFIKLTNYQELRTHLGLETYNAVLKRVGDKLQRIGQILNIYTDTYFLDRGLYAIVGDANKYEELHDMGRMILAYLNESFKYNKLEIKIESKICIAKCPEELSTYSSLLNFSNTFHLTIPDKKQVILLGDIIESRDFKMRNEIDDIIKNSIAENKFKMFYQPIYSVESDKFVSAEALIRLFDDEYGAISPGLFIPAAEESGAIHEIGDFVLDDVCRFIHEADFYSCGMEYIEINLSVSQCIEPKLISKVRDLILKYQVRPSQINLEITETAVDYDPKTTDNNIFGLWNMGFKFSLDDYGTGYSNIKRVVSLPLDIVKLDKSFVDEMDDPQMWIVIVNTVNMLKHMNKKILVEGVENERTLRKFIELGCDYIQGFYFSKPLSEEDFIKFVREKNKFSVLAEYILPV